MIDGAFTDYMLGVTTDGCSRSSSYFISSLPQAFLVYYLLALFYLKGPPFAAYFGMGVFIWAGFCGVGMGIF